jgi:nickel/cobalt exporter
MSQLSLPVLAAAFGVGVVHGLTPCAHSWPVLVPIVGRTGSVLRPAVWYGSGVVLAGVALGIVAGGAGAAFHRAADRPVGIWIENGFGVLMIAVGLVLALRTRLAHAGHVHGDCAPHDLSGADPSCDHAGHKPSRVVAHGRHLGLFVLGVASVTVPCWSNFMAASVSVTDGDLVGGAAAYGVYAFAAALTTYVVLRVVRHGDGLLARLGSPQFEARLLLLSGVGLILWGVATLLHIGHDHHHG